MPRAPRSVPSSSIACCRFCPSTRPSAPGEYAQLAHAEIDELLDEGRLPIVVGGTGLYLRAALTELSLRPAPAEGVRERWLGELERRGPQALHAILARRAPWSAAEIDPTDRQRIVRALELLDAGELEPPQEESELWSSATRHPTLLVGLTMEREQLYERIDARVDPMLASGVQNEVRLAAAARCVPDRPQGARIRGAAGRRRRGDETPNAQLRAPAADLDAKAGGGQCARRDRSRPRRRCRRSARAVAQNTGTNGYMSTTATTTPSAQIDTTAVLHRRRSRHSRDAR